MEKRMGLRSSRLAGRNIALIFEKTSTRTRSAFEVTAYDEGAHVTYLGPGESQLGRKESVRDTARGLDQADNWLHTIKAVMVATARDLP